MCNELRAVSQNLRTDPPLKISLQELEKAIIVHKELLSDLFVQLSPVMKPPTPEVCSDAPQLVVSNKSEVCRDIDNMRCNLGTLSETLREILSRLDV